MTPSLRRLPMIAVALVVVLLVPTTPAAAGAAATGGRGGDQSSAVVLDWERTSIRTIFTDNATPIPVGALYLGFTSLAMYRATQAAGRHASAEAAAATAAHDVLLAYFPVSRAKLDADLTASLARVPDGKAEQRGQQAGARVAADLIASRVGDGRNDTTIAYTKTAAPGVWPAAPMPGGMLAPWLGFVKPLMLRQPIDPPGVDGPPPLSSARQALELNEVKRLGSEGSTARSEHQTYTAQFFNSNSAIMISEGLLSYLDARPMRLTDTARLFAAAHTAMSDAVITCWRHKYEDGFWRPFQAIHGADTDGNPATAPDPAWKPLIANPPYSDYVSGHGCLTSPTVQAIRRTLGERTRLTLHSYNTSSDWTFNSLRDIEYHAFHARIWGGLHFRTAMVDAYAIGHTAADRVLYRLG